MTLSSKTAHHHWRAVPLLFYRLFQPEELLPQHGLVSILQSSLRNEAISLTQAHPILGANQATPTLAM